MLDHILDRIRQEGSERDRDFDFRHGGFSPLDAPIAPD
jgi:hypothetical protein